MNRPHTGASIAPATSARTWAIAARKLALPVSRRPRGLGNSRGAMRVFAKDKIALVTGANTGMGKYTSQELAREGYEVLMACRDEDKGKRAAQEVAEETRGKTRFIQLDLASISSVSECAKLLQDEARPLDRLVNNAGIMACPPWKTADGFEAQMGTNHLGHFALTLQLLPLLAAAGDTTTPARIVNVASAAHKGCKELDTSALAVLDKVNYVPWGAYGASKAANILFTRELARRLKEQNMPITANALCPGLVATDLGRYLVDGAKWYMKPFTALIIPFMMSKAQSIPKGSSTALHLALSEDIEGISGEYFVDSELSDSSELTQNMKLAKDLWEASETLTGAKLVV
eukprot:CAMPEP_0118939844 /NCGR_PEP_ID=MMETSP1169-20130426/29980_1 /TAXON_ID=36882 /ORGANISM="Pyramimonas obovata, Strain CCMP722" /LENGTH=345 /DNA_ID=CAMNT_0006884197 /DNA_START=89 /DNA_END=1126 /DNA_ORIENTATION=-